MWKLHQGYPILLGQNQELPFPKDGILTGFGCPICYRTLKSKSPLMYVKNALAHLIGITCRDSYHYFRTPFIKDVIEEVAQYNQSKRNPSQFSHLLNSEPSSSVEQSASQVTQSVIQCRGINGVFASGHRIQCLKQCPNNMCQQCCLSSDKTCTHHRHVKHKSSNSAAHIKVQLQSRVGDLITSEPRRSTNRFNPQADRRAFKDLPRKAIAHHNAARQRTQAAKENGSDYELTLLVWLQAGEHQEILVTALTFPRFALNESRSLERLAHKTLGPSWDLELEKLIDAHLLVTYPSEAKNLLIRASGLLLESCVGIDDAIKSLKIETCPTTFIGTSKRKNPAIESSPLAKKKPRKLLPFPGSTLKLSELLIWCSKAPDLSAKGVAKATWNDLFADQYKADLRPFESHSARSAFVRVIANHLICQGRFETAKILLKECGHSIPNEHITSCESLYCSLNHQALSINQLSD
ncbi:hypothetical protein DFH28DRAFT_1084468 [Melampsora americana]|nr:hypothetical protein DFH28DRAFT_1084468 [Melampsora americana]